MVKRLPLLAIILLTQTVHAQNWSLFPLGQRSYFHLTSDTGLAVVSQVMDSIKPNGDNTILYFLRKQGPDSLNDCFREALANSFLLPLPESVFPMDSMTLQGDSAYWFPAPGDGNFFFLPHVSEGQSWTVPLVPGGMQQTTFTCISAQEETFLGITDSVKTFALSTSGTGAPPINAFQFKLSKTYGLIEYLPFVLTVPHSSWLPLKTYSLIGIDDGLTNHGYTQPGFSEYFHLSPGDILQWEETYVPFDQTQQPWTKFQQDSITSALITPDSVVYTFQRTTMDISLAITQVVPGLSSHFLRDKMQYLVQAPTNWYGLGDYSGDYWSSLYIAVWNSGPLQLILDPASGDTISSFSFGSDGTLFDPEYCGLGGTSDLYMSFTLDTRVGILSHCMELTSSPDCWSLIGWRIDGVVTGDIKMALTTGLNKLFGPNVSISPNPVRDRLRFQGLSATGLSYVVLDPTGKELQTGPLQGNSILLSGLAPGLYLVKLSSGPGSRTFRIVKE